MILEHADWLFLINHEAGEEYYREEVANHCNCGYCRNFYASIDIAYPNLRYFMSRFAVDIEGPDSLTVFSPVLYQATYLAQGKILRIGSEPLSIDDVIVDFEECTEPDCFLINLGLMSVPWVLNERAEEIGSSAQMADYFSDFRNK